MTCPQCGASCPDEAAACAQCGGPLLDAPTGPIAARGDQTQTGLFLDLTPGPAPAPAGVEQTYIVPATYVPSPAASGGATPAAPAGGAPIPAEFANGSIFAKRYEVQSLLGQGGMGQVYLVKDLELDKVVALKTVRSDTQEGVQAIQRFKQELLLARRITHKNVVRIHDLGEADGIKYFTMEYVEGESLEGLIRRRGRVSPSETVHLARQILSALQEAHAQGVIHRDMKPQNVMVDPAGNAYLMDFGIARAADMDGMTATGAIVGTPDYIAPELVRGEKADAQADIFSFGVILYRMLTGELPFNADTAVAKIMMRLNQAPRPVREIVPDLPKHLDLVVRKCMEVDQALRYRSAAEILADLDREQVEQSMTLRLQRVIVRNRSTAAAWGIAALAAGGGIYWAGHRSAAPAPAAAMALPTRSVAILPFGNATGAAELEWMRMGLPDMLVTDLAQSQYVRPVPAERVLHVLQQAGLTQQSRFDEAALEAVAGRTRAHSVLAGQIVESGGKLRLELVLRRAGSGVSVPLRVEGETARVFALVDEVAKRLKAQLDLSPEQLKADTDRSISEVSTASLEARKAYQEGLAQLRKGANQEAVPLFEKATQADPAFAMAFARLAQAQLELGQQDAAGKATERAEALAEKAPLPASDRYQIHAVAALVKEDNEAAAKTYGELVKLNPDDPEVQMSLGSALEQLGRLPDALQAYQAVVRLDPGHGAALLGLGRVQVRSGRADEAIRSLQDALATKQFDDEPEALGMIHSIMGVAYRDTGAFDKALAHLQTCLEIRTKLGDKRGQGAALQNLATVLENLGEVEKAIAMEKKALALYRELRNRAGESLILNAMGQTYKSLGNLDKALAAFRESMQIEQEREDHQNMAIRLDQIADIYRLKGQYDDALVYLGQAKTHIEQTHDNNEKALNLMYTGLVHKAQGLYKEATEAFLAALPLFQESHFPMGLAIVQMGLGDIYGSQGRYGDGEAAYRESLKIYGELHAEHDLSEAQTALAHLLLDLGQAEAAEKTLAEAEHLGHDAHAEGGVPGILLGRARLALMRGQTEPAATLFEQANVKANLSGQKEVAVASRVALGRLALASGKAANAKGLLLRTRDEAAAARLRPLEAEARVVLAQTLLAAGNGAAAQTEAEEAIRLADKYAGKPVAFEALAALAEAQHRQGREREALDAYVKAAEAFEWIRRGLKPEQVAAFAARREIQAFLKTAALMLEKGGRAADAAPLKKLLGPQRS
jgi:tetratricopeptide (TPR) repeat protein